MPQKLPHIQPRNGPTVTPHRPITLLLMTFAAQLVGLGAGLAGRALLSNPFLASIAAPPLPAYLTLAVHAGVAYAIARWLRFPRSWQLLNLVLAPAAVLCIHFNISPELALLPVLALLLVYVPTFWTRVPFYPTSRKTYDAILGLLPAKEGTRMIDLGSGFGSLLLFLKETRPDLDLEGVEISPLPFFLSFVRSLRFGPGRPRFALKSFWGISFESYDVVYAFLAPGPMARLWEKVRREMRPGTLFIVNSFPVDATPERTVEIHDGRRFVLYTYRL